MIEGTQKPNGAGRPGRRPRQDVHLLEGTKLLREWRCVMHEVTVIDGGYEHQGSATGACRRSRARSPVPSGQARCSSACARPGAADELTRAPSPRSAARSIPESLVRKPRAGLQQPRRPARGLCCLHRQPAPRRLARPRRPLRRWRLQRRHAGAAGAATADPRYRGRQGRYRHLL